MSDEVEPYKEPTNEQLANFLIVYAGQVPGTEGLQLSPPILELLMNNNPQFRAGALRHHRMFHERLVEMTKKAALGQLPCQHIRPNGKQCPNFNQPGSYYCGLHQEDE